MPLFMQMGIFLIMSLLANGKVLISGKARVNNPISALLFNSIVFAVVGCSVLAFLIGGPVSGLTLVTAAVYAALTVIFQLFYIMALEKGPISIIVLIANLNHLNCGNYQLHNPQVPAFLQVAFGNIFF